MLVSLMCMSLDCERRPQYPERTDADTETACKLHSESAREPSVQPSYCEATALLTMHSSILFYLALYDSVNLKYMSLFANVGNSIF